MAPKRLTACGVALLVALAAGVPAAAGPVTLAIQDGRVSLAAQDATLAQVLAEWERVGHTRIVNRELLPPVLVTLSLTSVPETEALAILLRTVSGYVAVRRTTELAGASVFNRIVITSNAAPVRAVASSSTPQPSPQNSQPSGSRQQVQRRVLADGRVVSFVENPDRPGELTMVDDDGLVQPGGANRFMSGQMGQDPVNPDPLVGPGGRGVQMPPGGSYPGQAGAPRGGQMSADPFNLQPPAGAGQSGPSAIPMAPGTAVSPGVLVPGQKPPGPPKGPGVKQG